MVAASPQPVYRKDFTPTPYYIDSIHMDFLLLEGFTKVKSKLCLLPNYNGGRPPALVLDGRSDIKLVSIKLAGKALSSAEYQLTGDSLIIENIPRRSFEVDIEVDIKPQDNTLLEGLYISDGNFCTHCEAEGFRGITFFYDRPDIMAKYTVRIEAEKCRYPVLLSNGNLIDSGTLDFGRHFATWQDPLPKPSYLFALVAADLSALEDSFTTMSGRQVKLRIWVKHDEVPRAAHAMASLKKAMKWDEDTFGREYHLDKFDIVCLTEFNIGAMENTSLNIFLSELVLASPSTATDEEYARIEGIIAHEYFHNWTGNRVTCRDWFQLTLKEGLTVFRDQEFSSDMNSRAAKRIEDVSLLREQQFPEDSGSMAHPIRPDSYVRMDNFYSPTVYIKGAEVIRLYQTVLGVEGFRKGMDLYFQRHDGQAVTCDDFLAAMADANKTDLSSLGCWYGQAGTPRLKVETAFSSAARTLTITASQSVPATPGQQAKVPVLVPLRIALLASDGSPMPLHLEGQAAELGVEAVLRLEQERQTFTLTEVAEKAVLSVLRGFSAPVKLEVAGRSDGDLSFLLAHDSDSFSRWDAGQSLQTALLLRLYAAAADPSKGKTPEERFAAVGGVPKALTEAFALLLMDEAVDPALTAAAIASPSLSELIGAVPEADPVMLHRVRAYVSKQLAQQLRPELEGAVKRMDSLGGSYSPDPASCAKRKLKNQALLLLSASGEPEILQELLLRQREASNMTDELAAVAALANTEGSVRDTALEEFYAKWSHEDLAVLKWLRLKAGSNISGNVAAAQQLTQHPAFNIRNPSCCQALFGSFSKSAPNFHAADGSGYIFMADGLIKVDKFNRTCAGRLANCFAQWKQLDSKRQRMMQQEMTRIVEAEGVSENLYEVASKCLR